MKTHWLKKTYKMDLFLLTVYLSTFLLYIIIALILWNRPAVKEIPFDSFQRDLESLISKTIPLVADRVSSIDKNQLTHREKELIQPESMMAWAHQLYRYQKQLNSIQNCTEFNQTNNDVQERKLFIEYGLACQNQKDIPHWLWQDPPSHHPLGGSWAQRLVKNYGLKHSIDVDKRMHFLESKDNTYALNQNSLSSLLRNDLIYMNQSNVFIRLVDRVGQYQFQILDIQSFYRLTHLWPYRFQAELNENCIDYTPTGCWTTNSDPFVSRLQILQWIFLTLFFILSFLLIFIFLLRHYRITELRSISSMAISHELRHPVTTLNLILDEWRRSYDSLPESSQQSFVHFASQVQRLKLLVKATDVFLKPKPDSSIQWNIIQIQSLNQWGQQLADDFSAQFLPLEKDQNFQTDGYWLRVVIDNLLKNATGHGRPPVTLQFTKINGGLRVSVTDHGPGLQKNHNSTKGLGLGYTLAQKIIDHMEGKGIFYSFPPCRFEFIIQELEKK